MATDKARQKRNVRTRDLRDLVGEWAAKHDEEALTQGVLCWLGPHAPKRDNLHQGIAFAVVAHASGQTPPFEAYALANGLKSRLDRQVFQTWRDSRFRVVEVTEVDPGVGVRVEDVFSGAQLPIIERAASKQLSPGDWLYGTIYPIDGASELEGTMCVIAPRNRIVAVQAVMAAAAARGGDPATVSDLQTREMAREVMTALRNGERQPRFLNYDRDPVELIEATLDVPWRDVVAAGETWAQAEVDDDVVNLFGRIETSLSGPIVLATFRAEPDGRTGVHVNSRRRLATALQAWTEHTGRPMAVVSEQVKELPQDPLGPEVLIDASAFDGSDPEAAAAMAGAAYAESWPDVAIPALDGQSPRQALGKGRWPEVRALLPDLDPEASARLRLDLGV